MATAPGSRMRRLSSIVMTVPPVKIRETVVGDWEAAVVTTTANRQEINQTTRDSPESDLGRIDILPF